MNDLMSFGLHRLWKDTLINFVRPEPGLRVLDIGGGTGDIAFGILKRGGTNVTVIDTNAEMLAVGRDRAIDRGIVNQIDWVRADAEELPFSGLSVDVYVTAFCLRNVSQIELVLSEAYRVLKPGGRFICLEFSKVSIPVISKIYDAWSFKVIPHIGNCIAGDREAYEYLVRSIRDFPNPELLQQKLESAKFSHVRVQTLSAGIVAIHSGRRI